MAIYFAIAGVVTAPVLARSYDAMLWVTASLLGIALACGVLALFFLRTEKTKEVEIIETSHGPVIHFSRRQ